MTPYHDTHIPCITNKMGSRPRKGWFISRAVGRLSNRFLTQLSDSDNVSPTCLSAFVNTMVGGLKGDGQ